MTPAERGSLAPFSQPHYTLAPPLLRLSASCTSLTLAGLHFLCSLPPPPPCSFPTSAPASPVSTCPHLTFPFRRRRSAPAHFSTFVVCSSLAPPCLPPRLPSPLQLAIIFFFSLPLFLEGASALVLDSIFWFLFVSFARLSASLPPLRGGKEECRCVAVAR